MHRVLNREELLAVYDEEQEKMSPRERQQHLDRRLEKQIRFACKTSSAVREMFDSAGMAPSSIRMIASSSWNRMRADRVTVSSNPGSLD